MSHTHGGYLRFTRLTVFLLAVALATSGLVTLTTTSAEASTRGPGFSIKWCKYADCSWIGARRLGDGQRIYRVQPRKSGRDTTFHAPYVTSNFNGSSSPSAKATSYAAWIASFYGPQARSGATNYIGAGVDAALYHSLVGGDWKIGHTRGAARMRQTGVGSYVKTYAKAYLYDAYKHAGPYRQSLTVSRANAGSATKVTYRIWAPQSGLAPVPDGYYLPVTFKYPGQANITSYTNAQGVATATFTARAGKSTVIAAAVKVPENRLFVRKPKSRPRASAVIEAGHTRTMSISGTGIGVVGQAVDISNSTSNISTGQAMAGQYTVTGGYGTRRVVRRVFGPFSSASGATCSGTPKYSSTVSISGAGTWNLPGYSPATSGYYRWQVVAGANTYTSTASACGSPVYAAPGPQTVSVANASLLTRVGHALRGNYTISGGSGARSVSRRVFGPFNTADSSACGGTPAMKSDTTISSGGTWTLPTYNTPKSGYYRWGVYAGSNSNTLAASACARAVKVQKVATITQQRPTGSATTVGAGQLFRVWTVVGAFDRSETHSVTSRLYGPFSTFDYAVSGCASGSRLVKGVSAVVSTNGTYSMPTVSVTGKGYYAWRSQLDTRDLIIGATSSCGIVMKVN